MNTPAPAGRLVVVEGIDGAGKSTIVRALAGYCGDHQVPHVVSHEPTKGKWGAMLRASARTGRLPLEEELQLFQRDRAEHVEMLISPSLRDGKVVILDRYYFSTAAYQGARGGNPAAILSQNEAFAPAPDLVLLLDLDPLAGRARIRNRGEIPDDFEGAEALAVARQIFRSIERPCIRRIDASRDPAEVQHDCLAHLRELLERSEGMTRADPANGVSTAVDPVAERP